MNDPEQPQRDIDALLDEWAEISSRARPPAPERVRRSSGRGLLAGLATAAAAVVVVAFVGVISVLQSMPAARPATPAPNPSPAPSPAALSERDGIRLELWLDRDQVHLGERLLTSVRITNIGSEVVQREGNDCPTGPAAVRVAAQGLPGQRWDGIAAEFKQLALVEAGVLGEDGRDVLGLFRDERYVGGLIPIGCPGASLPQTFGPGEVLESNVVWHAGPADGFTPRPGPAAVAATFSWSSGEVSAEADIEIAAGQQPASLTLVDYVDGALANDDFRLWLDQRPRTSWSNTNIVRWPNAQGEYPPLPAYEGLNGPVVEVGLFRETDDTFELGAVIVDARTGTPLATRFEP